MNTRELTLPSPLPGYVVDVLTAQPGAPIRIDGLRLHLIDTDEGTEFHVIGRGVSIATLSYSTAIDALERRLTDAEGWWLETNPRYSLRDLIPTASYDRLHGWSNGPVTADERSSMEEHANGTGEVAAVAEMTTCKVVEGCPHTAPRFGRFAGKCLEHRGVERPTRTKRKNGKRGKREPSKPTAVVPRTLTAHVRDLEALGREVEQAQASLETAKARLDEARKRFAQAAVKLVESVGE